MPLARHDMKASRDVMDVITFLLTCLLRGMTGAAVRIRVYPHVSTHMPLARHDVWLGKIKRTVGVSTHMPLARHDYRYMVTA